MAELGPVCITITVYGTPAPQGSKRAFAIRRNGVLTGQAAVIESSHDRVKAWRQAVIDEVRSELTLDGPLEGPLAVGMTFRLARPKSHYRTGRNAHLLRDDAPAYPIKPPDSSKLARATEDALTDVGMWIDDAQVVAYDALCKIWAVPGATQPGATITIRRLEPPR